MRGASLLKAGWKGAKATIRNAFPLTTESAQRMTARGKLALDTSIVVIWKIEEKEEAKNILDIKEEIIKSTKCRTKELIDHGHIGRDVLIGAMAVALNIVTKHNSLYGRNGDLELDSLLTKYVIPFTATGIVESLKNIVGEGKIKTPEGLFYMLIKCLFVSGKKRTTKKMDRNDITLLKIATKVDKESLRASKLIQKKKSKFILQEPHSLNRPELERFLKENRDIDLANPKIRNSIDILHLMEYYSQIFPLDKLTDRWNEIREEYPTEAEEAFTLGSILYQILPDVDPEKGLSEEFVRKIKGEKLEV